MPEVTQVTCPACGRPGPAGGRYCTNCAAPLAAGDVLGAVVPPDARYQAPAGRRAATSGWVKALIVALIVAVVAAVVVAVVLAVGVGRASNNVSNAVTPKAGRPAGYHGPSYPGMLVQDHVAGGAGSSLTIKGETLTAGNLVRTLGVLGPTLCSPVTVTNGAATSIDVGPSEWKLQQPNGVIATFALTGTLPFGQVAPGGRSGGNVCFPDTGAPHGTYLLLWQPLLQAGRGVWLLPF